ncbi:SCO6880 family protein [Actinomyces wuliandei]|uniref:SCO6880 family protein n=1 Tax=Actinomyces wuliandei TaxID=2057743 RepID=UPI00111BB596|nr:SCO6880 family protein [Actinomyces wuliandei]
MPQQPTTPTPPVAETFPRRSTRGVLLGLSWAQAACLLAASLTLTTGLATAGTTGLPATLALTTALTTAALAHTRGRPLVAWLPVLADHAARRATGQHQYRRPLWRTRPAGTLSLPGSRARLRQHVDEATGTVMVHDPTRQTLAATLAVDHTQFMVLDETQQATRATAWAAFLNTVGQTQGTTRIQVLTRSHQDAGTSATAHWRTWPTKAQEGTPHRASYEELLSTMTASTEVHRSTITIVIDLHALRHDIRARGGGITGAAALMRDRMSATEQALTTTGLTPAGWLGPDELALIIRAAYDPARATALERHPEVLGDLDDAGPMAVDNHWACVRTDSGWHKVMVLGWPRTPVVPGFLHNLLLVPGTRITMSQVYEPVPTDKALNQARHDATEEQTAAQDRARVGRTETVLHARDRQAVDDHLTDLDSGWTDIDHAALLVISAPTRDELTRLHGQVRAAAGRAAARLDTLTGQQDELLDAAALPLGLGVRR